MIEVIYNVIQAVLYWLEGHLALFTIASIKPLFPELYNPHNKEEIHENKNFEIYNNNTFEVLDSLIDKKVKFNCIFADPPYFLSNDGITCVNGKMVKVNKGEWDKSKGIEQNFQFNYDWLERCKNLLTDSGTIWVSGTFHIIYAVAFAAQKLEMKFLNNIVWENPNPPPNLSCRYFTHSTETILWFGKHKKSRHLFNYKTMKKINNNKQMKDVWRMTAPKKEEKKIWETPNTKTSNFIRLDY